MIRFDAIWKFGVVGETSSYTDYTNNTKTNTAITFISASTDVFYLGLENRFTGICVDLSTNGSYTGLSFEYYDGDTWSKLSLLDSYTFNTSKFLRWDLPKAWIKYNFTSTEPQTATPPDTEERYWIKITATAVTTAAVISEIRAIPYAFYTSPTKVYQMLQLKNDFSSNSSPTDLTVEDLIRRAEDRIDYITRKSWRFNAVSEDIDSNLVDYNRYGFYLRHRNFRKVYSVAIWNGSDWETLTEGRNNDYFVNYNLGMVYFTRLFLLPAAYGMTGRYFHFGFGEYKNSVKVEYLYGRDPETDREFFMVEDIATKMAACDVLRHHDYSGLIVSGTDKISLEAKVSLMQSEIDQKLAEITAVAIY